MLLEAPPIRRSSTPKVLLAIDLTTPVVDEAIKLGTSVIVAYRTCGPILCFKSYHHNIKNELRHGIWI